MRGLADDAANGASVAGDAEALAPPGMPMEASSFSSRASYLEAVSSAVATMPPDALRQSLEYVLPPVLRVLRAETRAFGSAVDADTPSEPEPSKRRASRLEALESAARCVSRVVRRAGRCGTAPDTSLETFAALVSALGSAVDSSDATQTARRERASSASAKNARIENATAAAPSSGALEHVRLAALDAMRGALSVFADADAMGLVEKDASLPVLGYAISLLLETARGEASKGALGSRACRREALAALAELVAEASRGEALLTRAARASTPSTTPEPPERDDVPGAPRAHAAPSAVAFFLPGVVSGCARAIAASVGSRAGHGAGPASAAEDSAAAEAAATALATVCRATLADADFASPGAGSSSAERSALAAELRGLAERRGAAGASACRGGEPSRREEDDARDEAGASDASDASEPGARRLRVARDAKWLETAAPRVGAAAAAAFGQLATHAKPSARAAAGLGALTVLETCGSTLGETASVALLSAALVVARDPWRSASEATRAALERMAGRARPEPSGSSEGSVGAGKRASTFRALLTTALRESLRALPRSVKRESMSFDATDEGGGGGEGGACARRAAAAIDLLDADALAETLLTDEGARRDVSVALAACFEMAPLGFEGALVAVPKEGKGDLERDVRARSARWLVFSDRDARVVPPPAPPPRTSFLSDAGLFAAVAGVARALGRHPASLPALLEAHLRALRETLAGARDAEEEEARARDAESRERSVGSADVSAADAWRRKARAHVAVAVELLLGSAEARVESSASPRPGRSTTTASPSPSSSARNALEAFLASGAWDLPTSPAAAASAARRRRREAKRERRSVEGRRRDGVDGPSGNATRAKPGSSFGSDSGEDDSDGSSEDDVFEDVSFGKTARENALLACLLIEAVGSTACACGSAFVKTGGFLPTALVPLLLKLGDENALVRAAAEATLFRVADIGGFFEKETTSSSARTSRAANPEDVSAAIGALISANADYVVDALSRRLRRLEAFPDAARFFAAVLGSGAGGAARNLLPFLRDPIARAAEAVSVAGRASFFATGRRDPDDGACAFMRIMTQTALAALAEARETDDEIAEAAKALAPLTRARAEKNLEAAERSHVARSETERASDDRSEEDETRALEALSETDASVLTRALPPSLSSWRRRQTRLSRTSKLCAVMVRAAAPLMESGDPRRRRLASDAFAASLRGCGALAASFAKDATVRDALRGAFPEDVPEDDAIAPEERVVKVLPLIHETWPHVAVALTGQPRGPSVKPAAFAASIDALAACAEASQPGNGSFVSRRLLRDAWPGLVRVLKLGVPSPDAKADASLAARLERVALIDGKSMTASYAATNGAAPSRLLASAGASDGGHVDARRIDDPSRETPASSAATTRASATARMSVLRLLETLASRGATAEATRDVAPFAIAAAVPFALDEVGGLGFELARRLKQRAIAAVAALAAIDPDAAWMELAARATGRDDAPVPVAPAFAAAAHDRDGTRSCLPRLPSFREISPTPSARVSQGVAAAAARLLATVEGRAETEANSRGERAIG